MTCSDPSEFFQHDLFAFGITVFWEITSEKNVWKQFWRSSRFQSTQRNWKFRQTFRICCVLVDRISCVPNAKKRTWCWLKSSYQTLEMDLQKQLSVSVLVVIIDFSQKADSHSYAQLRRKWTQNAHFRLEISLKWMRNVYKLLKIGLKNDIWS